MRAQDYNRLSNIHQALLNAGEEVDGTEIAFRDKVEITERIRYAADTINLALVRGRAEAEAEVLKPVKKWKELIRFFFPK